MKGIQDETGRLFSFLANEYIEQLKGQEQSPFFEDSEQDELLLDNLLNRVHSDSTFSVLTETDVAFLQHICDVHLNHMASSYGSLWTSAPEEERAAIQKAMEEVRTTQMSEQHRWLTYQGYSGTYQVLPKLNRYVENDNLYIGLDCFDVEFGGLEPFTDLTVNVGRLPYLQSAIDTNNNGLEAIAFLQKNGFGHLTGTALPSGFCMFPIFEFNEEKLRAIEPEQFSEYAHAHGQQLKSLNAILSQAEKEKDSPFHKKQKSHNKNRE